MCASNRFTTQHQLHRHTSCTQVSDLATNFCDVLPSDFELDVAGWVMACDLDGVVVCVEVVRRSSRPVRMLHGAVYMRPGIMVPIRSDSAIRPNAFSRPGMYVLSVNTVRALQ